MEFYSKKRVSIIVEKVYKDKVIMLLEECGASGYTVYKGIYGKGRHGVKEDYGGLGDFTGNVEIVSITGPEVADCVLRGLQRMIERGIELIVHVLDVSVIRNDHFN
ncbi:MAG: P-II family nitrogen regulator [Thermincolia bacterium]